MARMVERYTGTVFDVQPERVEEFVSRGFRMIDDLPTPHIVEEAEEPEIKPDDQKPDEDSTIAEIKAYAAAHGISIPAGIKKAEMLALI